MVDITSKSVSLRTAVAEAVVKVSDTDTIKRILNDEVPKGNVFAMSKAAGLLGIKKTPELLPDCHPIPIEYANFDFTTNELNISIKCTIKTIYKTGVEVEAMHGASIAALNIYDMLKPIDKGVEILNIRLLEKRGGKSDFKDKFSRELTAAVVVCSDTIAAGQKEDRAGVAIGDILRAHEVTVAEYLVIPDEPEQIRDRARVFSSMDIDMIIFCGGTGLSRRDQTPETLEPLLERRIPGIEETIRRYGQERMPYAMLSRSIAGTIGQSLVLALPGSTGGARESMEAIFPSVLHLFGIFKGVRHDK